MSSTSIPTRIVIWIIAIAFMISSLGLSIAVIWQAYDSRDDDTSQDEQKTLTGSKLENYEPVSKVDKLETIDTKVGLGREAKVGDTVVVDYTGAYATSGIIFESSLDAGQPTSFALDEASLIKGFVQGITGMKEGGMRRILIPSSLGYGETGNGTIQPNTDLVFDITLQAIGE